MNASMVKMPIMDRDVNMKYKMKNTKKLKSAIFLTFLIATIWGCTNNKSQEKEMVQENEKFEVEVKEVEVGNQKAKLFHIDNGQGMKVEISSFGGIITKILVPDKNGNSENIVLGYADLLGYDSNDYYFGAAIGRFGNRIAEGKFELDGNSYQLATNDGDNHLHGGMKGFNRVVWNADYEQKETSVLVKMSYTSIDGEEGYPGNLETTLSFEITDDNKILLEFKAQTDKPTVVNLTHHGYFNLSAMKEDVLEHQLTINAANYTPVDDGLIPTGELKEVKETAFDFQTPHTIGARIGEVPGGYDHNFVVKENHSEELVKMAELYHQNSGRMMELYADSPAVQFYSGNFLDGKVTVDGVTYSQHMGLCLEPQTFPNAPNEPSFPTSRLNPGETYSHKIQYVFGVR